MHLPVIASVGCTAALQLCRPLANACALWLPAGMSRNDAKQGSLTGRSAPKVGRDSQGTGTRTAAGKGMEKEKRKWR